jgi:hypothetical protein
LVACLPRCSAINRWLLCVCGWADER